MARLVFALTFIVATAAAALAQSEDRVPIPVPWPGPDPDPTSLAQRVEMLEQLVFELIDVAVDPTPQPSKSVLFNREIRLESVKRLTKQFESGLKQLAEEQKQLTSSQK